MTACNKKRIAKFGKHFFFAKNAYKKVVQYYIVMC
jgi:hypothetical protein